MCSIAKDSKLSVEFVERFLRLELEDNGIDCDCEFIVGSQNVVVRGHKFIFSAASKVLKAMFYGELKEEKAVIVEDLDPDSFQGMKQFIYTGEVNFLSALHALFIYTAARKYIIPDLIKSCIEYITEEEIHPSEVLEFYEYCKIFNISQFEKLCCTIIQEKTEEVVESEYFLMARIETIELILKSPTLNLKSEIYVFDLFERWALAEVDRKKISEEEIATSFNSLKKFLRFFKISSKEFVSKVAGSPLLTPEEKLAIGCNLMEPDSKLMPKNLPLVGSQEFRNFDPSFIRTTHRHKHEFTVSLTDDFNYSCQEQEYLITINSPFTIRISYSNIIGKYICFYVQIQKIYEFSFELLLNIKSRIRVLAEKRADDLLLNNESCIELDPREEDPQKVIFTKIPVSELEKECFLRGTNTVVIEGLFNIIFESYV